MIILLILLVDGAIHKAAGRGLLQECIALDGCEVGDAKITSGHKLPSKFVVKIKKKNEEIFIF